MVDLRRLHPAGQEEREVHQAQAVHHQVGHQGQRRHGALGEHPQNGKCDSDGKAITFAFKNGADDFVTWNLYGAKGVKDELSEATIQKILGTVRLTKEGPKGA